MSFSDLQLFRPAFWLFYSGQNPVPSNQQIDAWLTEGGAEILRVERDWLRTSRLAYLDSSYYTIHPGSGVAARPSPAPREVNSEKLPR